MQCGYKFCKEKTGEGAKEIRDHNFIKDNGKKKRLEVNVGTSHISICRGKYNTGPETVECSGASGRMCGVKSSE